MVSLESVVSSSFLLQLHQDSITVFRMEEHDRFTMSSDSWILTQTSDVLTLDIRNSCVDIIDLNTNMMNTTSLVLL